MLKLQMFKAYRSAKVALNGNTIWCFGVLYTGHFKHKNQVFKTITWAEHKYCVKVNGVQRFRKTTKNQNITFSRF